MQLSAGQTLYSPGDVVQAVYFPGDAVLSVVTVMQDGRAVEAATVGNEGVVGVITALAAVPAHARTFAQIGGSIFRLPAAHLREMVAESPQLLKVLLVHVHQSIAQSEQSVACNALHSARERLARWLLLSQDRVGSAEIKLTQDYLAVMLGVQRTTVSSLAQEFKQCGAIRYSRGRILIIDRPALEDATCECYLAGRWTEHAVRA